MPSATTENPAIIPAVPNRLQLRAMGKQWCGIISVRVYDSADNYRTFWHVVVGGFSFGFALPACIMRWIERWFHPIPPSLQDSWCLIRPDMMMEQVAQLPLYPDEETRFKKEQEMFRQIKAELPPGMYYNNVHYPFDWSNDPQN
jgi:hypothetical protein